MLWKGALTTFGSLRSVPQRGRIRRAQLIHQLLQVGGETILTHVPL